MFISERCRSAGCLRCVYIWQHIHPFGSNLDSIGTVILLILFSRYSFVKKNTSTKMRGDLSVRKISIRGLF